ncbi:MULTISPECIES: MoxR family ATPase [unclassified Lentimonas]|uniref:AAA family ATPase n=1 Tax=unclassified Lentimonas TaxID=2630993 RepID=UPI00132406AB|nr:MULTISPECIES: MoxR family ATPase [unclassified Lentimonas]CAA6676642.1 MoxR-like ATPase in aerotolerance operon [Lentimonas sp. CC4]CAA6684695.1 MoxR-like ATPase in aerotolerance operon [Lentimonas sp. CC6]CAA6694106.1 MoxR-like ATPase in aerotolerance operon [Lentimonas sp. CC19]CAA6694395.1 MoxR-like ATPase in aerotolerance operon [Lentimonas sp. CC10]CAA7070339.1 MoxR-like ATPase in aerotolerance operon [Lentimonas sp. CC11]
MNEASLKQFHQHLEAARAEVAKVIIGQKAVVDLALITILTGGHALIEGVPGVAKTLLVRTLASVLSVESSRIQFTPDLMPADITGTNIFNMKTQEFTLIKGPVFTTFLLADEINRAPAKTQSALLQAMQERRVSIDREHIALDPSFTVFATQNPIEHEGTYALPQAQQDRFMLKILMDYPDEADELTLARSMLTNASPESVLDSEAVQPVLAAGELLEVRAALDSIVVREELLAYIVELVRRTRKHESVMVGAGPRATQALLLASRASAAIDGRDFVTPDDVKALSVPVLAHRLMLRPEYEIEGLTIAEVIHQLLETVPVPR